MRYRTVCTVAFVLLTLMPFAAQGQSFNCGAADRPDEVLICQSDRLSRLDERMSSLYFTLRNRLSGPERRALEESQRRWLDERFACGRDFGCIEQLYLERIEYLQNY
jgi:uncharacterized protein